MWLVVLVVVCVLVLLVVIAKRYVGAGIAFTVAPSKFMRDGYKHKVSFEFTRFGKQWTAISDTADVELFFRDGERFSFGKAYAQIVGPFWPKCWPVGVQRADQHVALHKVVSSGATLSRIVRQFRDDVMFRDPFARLGAGGLPVDLFKTLHDLTLRAHAVAFIGNEINDEWREFSDAYLGANPESAFQGVGAVLDVLIFGMDKRFLRMIAVMRRALERQIAAAGGETMFIELGKQPGASPMQSFFAHYAAHGPLLHLGDIYHCVCGSLWNALMASVVNTGIVGSWVVYHTAKDKALAARIRDELKAQFGDIDNPKAWPPFEAQGIAVPSLIKNCIGEVS
jgi:hypothetical protein